MSEKEHKVFSRTAAHSRTGGLHKYGNVAEKPECPVNSCISLREMPMADSRWTEESRFVLILYRFVSSFSFELCYDYL